MTRPSRSAAARQARLDSDTPIVLGYRRVSTQEQVASGAGLDAQRTTLDAEAQRRGWTIEDVVDEGLSAKDMNRPALTDALDRLDRGEADILVATKLDRVSRSVADFARLLDRANASGWRLVLLDSGIDTSTPAGEFVANTLASAAQYERRLISQRTKDGLAAKRAAGVRLGRPSVIPADIVQRIVAARTGGTSIRGIAALLNADGVPTAKGKPWTGSTIQAVLNGQAAAGMTTSTSIREGIITT